MIFDTEAADRLYSSSNTSGSFGKYEATIWSGVKRDIAWNSLDDLQKLELRKKDLVHKRKVDGIYPKSAILYEESVIELGSLIYDFLATSKAKTPNPSNAFIRLSTMLFCELYAINKHRELEKGGHVLYAEVMEGIFHELKDSPIYAEYALQEINEKFKIVVDRFNSKPYEVR